MCHVIGTLLICAVAGNLAGNNQRRRPILKSIVKGGIAAKRKIEAVSVKTVEETRRLADEARADLDASETEMSR